MLHPDSTTVKSAAKDVTPVEASAKATNNDDKIEAYHNLTSYRDMLMQNSIY